MFLQGAKPLADCLSQCKLGLKDMGVDLCMYCVSELYIAKLLSVLSEIVSLIMAMEPLKSKYNWEIIDFGVSKSTDLIWNTGHLQIHWQNVSIGKLFVNFYVNRKDSYDL